MFISLANAVDWSSIIVSLLCGFDFISAASTRLGNYVITLANPSQSIFPSPQIKCSSVIP